MAQTCSSFINDNAFHFGRLPPLAVHVLWNDQRHNSSKNPIVNT